MPYYRRRQYYRIPRKARRAMRELKRQRYYMRQYRDRLAAGRTQPEIQAGIPYGTVFRNTYGQNWASATDAQKEMRRITGYRGAGGYKKWLSRGLGAIGGALHGSLSGDPFGGAKAGWDAGSRFSEARGWGDYEVGSVGNQIMDGSGLDTVLLNNGGDNSGDIVVSKSEFLQNIVVSIAASGTSDFAISKFPINVGLQTTFPFLAQLASNYVIYDLEGLIFYYKPTSGEGASSSSNALGKIIMSTQYDPDAPDFSNSTDMLNYAYTSTAKPSVGIRHGVETAANKMPVDQLYVRTGTSTKAKNFTDPGTFYIATEGIPGTAGTSLIIGELHVAYQVRLSRPTIEPALFGSTIRLLNAVWYTGASAMLSGSVTYDTHNSLNATLSFASQTCTVTFDKALTYGDYLINVFILKNAVGVDSLSFTNPCTNGFYWSNAVTTLSTNPASSAMYTASTAAEQTLSATVFFNVNAPGTTTATFGFTRTSTAANDIVRLYITKINADSRR